MKRLLLLFSVPAILSGCLPPRGTPLTLNYYDRRFCVYSGVHHSRLSYDNRVGAGMEPAIAFRQLMCSPNARGEYHAWAYEQLDPAAPDPLVTALMLVACVSTGTCGPVDLEPGGTSVSHTSDFFRFARDIDPNAVRAALESIEAPEQVKVSFLERLEACRAHIVSAVAHMPRRLRAVFVDTIERTLADRRALLAELAPVAQSYEAARPAMDEALLNGVFDENLHERVRAIRDAAILTCTASGRRSARVCANGPISHVLTQYLVRSAAGLGRRAEAAAEQRVLDEMPDTTDERFAIHIAVGQAMARETRLARDYQAASERLASSDPSARERLLTVQFGSPAPIDLGRWNNGVGLQPPAAERIFHDRGRLTRFDGRVVRARRRGRAAVVDVERTDNRYGSERPTSFSIPWQEGQHLAEGHWVALVAEGDDARVVVARADGRDGPFVQVRSAYLGR